MTPLNGRPVLILLSMLCALPAFVNAEEAAPQGKATQASNLEAQRLFTQSVLPLLKRKCFVCHGDDPKEIQGELNMHSRAGLLQGGESEEPSLVPGSPDESPLYLAVKWDGLEMPPKENDRLTAEQIENIRRWIAAGAPWPKVTAPETPATKENDASANASDASQEGSRIATSGGISSDWTNRRYKAGDLWPYQPVQRYAVPKVKSAAGESVHPIDAFLRRKLEEIGVAPAAEADRRTLIRRVTFDLTGLPPAPEDVERFANDKAPGAYAHVVDRLLASKTYGDQMARHWLDVVRYADTSGFSNDYERPNAWRYRDYVVRSFNADKPYDRFIVEQIAGDELDEHDPEALLATGFLRMGPWEHTGMSVAAVTRQLFLDDVTHSVGVTFLAQGLRCARCHDHKFDPIPTRDYYRIQSVFAPVQFVDRKVAYQSYENTKSFAEQKPRTERVLREAKEFTDKLAKKKKQRLAAYLKEQGVASINDLPLEQRGGYLGLTDLEKSLNKIYRKRRDYFVREMNRYEPLALGVYSGPDNGYKSTTPVFLMPDAKKRHGAATPVHILNGGSLAAPGEEAPPGVLSAVAGSNSLLHPTAWNTIPADTQGRRLAFARWVASPNNTLTARVFVNRAWQMHFGQGICNTPNSFGKMGGHPTHPELLDWLAAWFVDHDWSVKKLHRLIVMSAAYRQSGTNPQADKLAEVDPRNTLLAYYSPRRMTAEELRDAMLAASGELNLEQGGPGVFPEIHWEVALQPRHIMGSVAPAYQPSPRREQRNRRTLYAFRYRTLSDPLLVVFNQPGSDISCERRDQTTVTPQVFALFNSQFTQDRSIAMAARLEDMAESDAARVEQAFCIVYGRAPTAGESRQCLAHVAAMAEHHRSHKPQVVELPVLVEREMFEELTGESFKFTEELDVMKHYQADLKPWEVGPHTRALADLCLVLMNSNEFVYVR